jgi:hypothetical protein
VRTLIFALLALPAIALCEERAPIRTFSAPVETLAALRCAREGHKYYVHLALDKYQCADDTVGIEKEAKDARAYLASLGK